MRTSRHQRDALCILAFLSTSQCERAEVVRAELKLPSVIFQTALKALQQAGYIRLSARKQGVVVHDFVEITDMGRAYFSTSVEKLGMLVNLLDSEALVARAESNGVIPFPG